MSTKPTKLRGPRMSTTPRNCGLPPLRSSSPHFRGDPG
jgi:hypothetical protein